MQMLFYAYQNQIQNDINLFPPEDARYCLWTPDHQCYFLELNAMRTWFIADW